MVLIAWLHSLILAERSSILKVNTDASEEGRGTRSRTELYETTMGVLYNRVTAQLWPEAVKGHGENLPLLHSTKNANWKVANCQPIMHESKLHF